MLRTIFVVLILLLSVGCEYLPREVYDIETKDGVTLKLYCPTIDQGRSMFTYFIDGDCVLIKSDD